MTIKTDLPNHPGLVDVFDSVIDILSPSHSYRDKVTGLTQLPYEQTLFLDSDACLISPVDDLFQLFECADLAVAHSPVRHPPGWSMSLCLAFPELKLGSCCFAVRKLLMI